MNKSRAALRNRKTILLDIRARRNTMRSRQRARIFNIIGKIALITSIVIGTWFGAHKMLTKFFFDNSNYNLHNIAIDPKEILSKEEVLATEIISASGLQLGTNIFTIDLEAVRKGVLSLPQIREVKIDRKLPDTIQISILPKKPVAWLICKQNSEDTSSTPHDPYTGPNSFLLEQEGAFYKPPHMASTYFALPVIFGLNQHLLTAGDQLETEDLSQALKLLHLAAKRENPPITLRSLDLSQGYCIKALSVTNEEIIFATENFEEQLNRLQELLRFCKQTGKKIKSVNLFVNRNTPVQFAHEL